jgi:enterochelin esterase-like enzyme
MRSSRRASNHILIALLFVLSASSCLALPGFNPSAAPPTITPAATQLISPTHTTTPGLVSSATVPPTLSPTVSPEPSFTPTLTPTITPTPCPDPLGSVQQEQIFSSTLNRDFDFRIFLPPCYDPQAPGGYPVLYLLHGQSMDDSAWDRFGADETAAALITSSQAPPFIIVMPREEYFLQDMTQSRFGEALLQDLLPWVDANYATCPERDCRAIGGLSRGAIWAFLIALENQHLFRAAGGHSLPGPVVSPYYLKTLWESMPENERIRLYMDIGEFDRYRPGAEEFRSRLEFLSIPHEWHLNPGTHNDAYWMAHVEEYLRWYASGW